MSTIEPKDGDTAGHGLSQDTRLQLEKLREHVALLTSLARPRTGDQGESGHAEIRPDEVAICLEQLEARIARVLDELSRPAGRGKETAASEADAQANANEDEDTSATEATAPDTDRAAAARRYLAGVTLEQIDRMNLLLESLHALGNVVACADHAELSEATLSVMGNAIYRDVDELREIVDDIYESQQLGPRRYPRTCVRETQASYLAPPIHSPTTRALSLVLEHPTYQ